MNFAVRMPDSLGESLKELSKKDSVSINQFIITAVAEKMATLKTVDLLDEMGKSGSAEHGLSMLKRVSKTNEPLQEDRREC